MSGHLTTLAGVPVYVWAPAGPPLDSERTANDVLAEATGVGASVVVLPVERLPPAFLELKTGLAGAVLQKFVRYGLRTAIVGDVSDAVTRSDALRAFVAECNRGSHVWFVGDLASLEGRLAKGA